MSYLRVLEKQAKGGELALKLGMWHFEQQQWGQAIRFLNQAIDKGRLEQPESAYRILGKCYLRTGNERKARAAFQLCQGN